MAKQKGRRAADRFTYLVSPLGENVEQTPTYSPSRPVDGAKGQGKGQASQSQSSKDQRRGS